MDKDTQVNKRNLARSYDAYYFAHACGRPYQRNEEWLRFFGSIAERIVSDIRPATALDAGCAMGFLVEALRQRGVEAFGVDVSEYAIQHVHPDIRPYCRLGTVTEPFLQKYALIVCIEVLEHLAPGEAERAIENFCQHSDDVLFSSTPTDYKEATHSNVQPPEHWAELFARHHFLRDVDFDASFITPWAVRFRRMKEPLHRLVREYERKFWLLWKENTALRSLSAEVRDQLAADEQSLKTLTAQLAEKEQAIQSLAPQAQENAEAVRALTSQIEKKAKLAKTLALKLAQKEEALQALSGQLATQEKKLQAIAGQLVAEEQQRRTIEASAGWKLLIQVRQIRVSLIPYGSRRERLWNLGIRFLQLWLDRGIGVAARGFMGKVKRLVSRSAPKPETPKAESRSASLQVTSTSSDELYQAWIAENEPSESELAQQRSESLHLPYRPLISVVTPVYNTTPDILRAMINSVLAQTYDRWQLCIVDGGSNVPWVKPLLAEYAQRDSRVQIKYLAENLGISRNSNEALALAIGDFVALLDHDDTLAPFALFEAVKMLNSNPSLDFIYSDKDFMSEDGTRRFRPLFKPQWSPEVMLNANYLTHLCIIRKSLVDEIGGFDYRKDGAQDWDLFLRVTERTDRIARIAQVLYHWRTSPSSVSEGTNVKPYALAAQISTVQAHLRRLGIAAEAFFEPPGYLRVRWAVKENSLVSIIVLATRNMAMLTQCIDSLIASTAFPNFEIIVVVGSQDNGFEASLSLYPNLRIARFEHPEDEYAARNWGAKYASGDRLLFLDPAVRATSPDWLGELAQWVERKEIGIVGTKLLSPESTIRHAGVVIGLKGLAGFAFENAVDDYGGGYGFIAWYRNYSAVSSACMLVRRDLFDQVGGFDERFIKFGGDVDLCLRIRAGGNRIVYTPFAQLRYLEKSIQPATIPAQDLSLAFEQFAPILRANDPYYSPNLSLFDSIPRPRRKAEPSAIELASKLMEAARQSTFETLAASQMNQWLQESVADATRISESSASRGDVRLSIEQEKGLPQNNSLVADRYSIDAAALVNWLDFSQADLERNQNVIKYHAGALKIDTINWFIPSFHHASYGGVRTILRFANYFLKSHGISNRFVILGDADPEKLSALIGVAFPMLADADLVILRSDRELDRVEPSDVAIATLWTTAYALLKFNQTKRKFYFIQDYEPLFYPAGSMSAQADATYRFGFYGIANTPTLKEIYEQVYGGVAEVFTPNVDTKVFYPESRERERDAPLELFFYGRPGHPRNGFELGAAALRKVKERLGDRVKIVAAGASWEPREYGLEGVLENLGLLEYEETAGLYRSCDVGLVMMFTRHPSYLPLELMASGCLVVTNHNPATTWLLKDEENCLISEASVSCLVDVLERALLDVQKRQRITRTAFEEIKSSYGDWNKEMGKIYQFMCHSFG